MIGLSSFSVFVAVASFTVAPITHASKEERTCFQVAHQYDPTIDIKADVAICYGINSSMRDRIEAWRSNGYVIHLMTGIAWGGYQDYLYGRFDGVEHLDDAQVDGNGNRVSHGGDVYYMVPSEPFNEYIKSLLIQALDAGVEAIHMEEPEFWSRSGYSEGFKREWRNYYGTDWVDPRSSVDAAYKSAKLKQYLYYRSVRELASFVKQYSRSKGKEIRFYVPTHSLINYTHWRIVSPESKLLDVPDLDGLIAQVWTGTSRTPNVFKGVAKERTLETAIMEYSYFARLVEGTNRRIWFLHDPIEDNPNHPWSDYGENYHRTVVASLLFPEISRFEVMPWPWRVFHGRYPLERRGDEWIKSTIPADYATEVLGIISTLNDMDQSDISWDVALDGVGIAVSDTMMFQEPDMSSFYGIALPLLKSGVLVNAVPLENLSDRCDVLFLSYEFMKPPTASVHAELIDWMKNGGTLIFVDDIRDEFNKVDEWWRRAGYESPAEHLFEQVGIDGEQNAEVQIGKGRFVFRRTSPKRLAQNEDGAETVLRLLAEQKPFSPQNHILLRRGPYVIAAVMDETDPTPLVIDGKYINIFDHRFSIVENPILNAGEVAWLYDLSRASKDSAQVLVSASRIVDERSTDHVLSFISLGPSEVIARTIVKLPCRPNGISLVRRDGSAHEFTSSWDADTGTLLLEYENLTDGANAQIHF